MIKTIVLAASVGAAALGVATPAFAQEAGDVTVGVSASRTKLIDKGDVYVNGVLDPFAGYSTRDTFHGTFDLTYFPVRAIALEASVSTPATTNNLPAGSLAGTPNLGDDEFVMATLGVRVQPFTGKISPYVGGGLQKQFTTQERDGLAVGLNIPNANGPYVKGGVQFNVSERWGIFAEARKAWYDTGASGLLPLDATYTTFAQVNARAVLDPLTISVGAVARFGKRADSDDGQLAPDTTRWTIRAGLTNLALTDKVDLSVGGAPYPGAGLSTYEHHTPTVQIGYFVTPHVAVNATLGLPPKIEVYGAGSIGALPKLGDVTYGPMAFTLQYHPLRTGRIRPYIGAGASYMVVFGTTDGAFSDLKVDNDLGFAFEAGSDFMVTEKFGMFAEVKKATLRPKAYGSFNGAPVVGSTKLDPLAFTGGVVFHF